MPKAYVRRQTRAKPIFRRVYRSPKPLRREFAHTLTATAATRRRLGAQII